MCHWVTLGRCAVVCPRYDLAIEDKHRSYRHFPYHCTLRVPCDALLACNARTRLNCVNAEASTFWASSSASIM